MASEFKVSRLLYVFLALFIVQVASQNDTSFCSISSAHTLCQYNGTGQSCTRFGNVVARGVDRAVEGYIVALHNIRRARVAFGAETRGAGLGFGGRQPAATNMNQLRWNNLLARIAQRWADQCIFSSDAVRNASINGTDGTPVYVGQNVYAYLDSLSTYRAPGTYPQPDYWLEAINSWYNEVQFFNPSVVPSYVFQAPVGHYTQLAWGATTEIGCGFTQWQYSNNRIGRILVCDYGVGGNRAGSPVYATGGAVCSACTTNCSGSLCTNQAGNPTPV